MTDTAVTASERLIYTDLKDNNNKYWNADLNDTTVTCKWGRVGDISGQKKTFTFQSAERAEKFFNSKVNSKLNKGYTKQRTLAEGKPANVDFVAKIQIQHSNDSETEALIDFLVKRNIHRIEGTTNIRMEAGKLTTPLGPVTKDGLEEAQALLTSMARKGADLDTLANDYLRIVPRNIGRRRIEAKSLFGSPRQLEAEQATLDSLRAVVDDIAQKAVTSTDAPPVFKTKLDLLPADHKSVAYLEKKFSSSINRSHMSSKLKLHKAWEMTIDSHAENFEKDLGNIKKLWHGTKDQNLLSILKTGFIIPKHNQGISIAGRAYGDGIYFSDQSTKSLNYCSSFWGGQGSQRSFMLFNEVAMGKEYLPKGYFRGTTCPKGFDSTFAKGGMSGVMNNEMIIYRPSQVNPIYLVEFR